MGEMEMLSVKVNGFENPAIVDTSMDSHQSSPPRDARRDSARRIRRTLCTKCVSPVNAVGYLVVMMSLVLCCISIFSPFWIYYPTRWGVPELERYIITYPFSQASWRGLWAICYREPNLYTQLTRSNILSRCVWAGDDTTIWNQVPGWWKASQGLFAFGLALVVVTLVIETLYACCHVGLDRAFMPVIVGSLTLTSALFCIASLSLFGDSSFREGETSPEPTGQGGHLDWAFFVGIGGCIGLLVASLVFYCDACCVSWRRGSCR